MKQEMEDALKKKYPKLLPEEILITTGDGWYWLIDKLCFLLQFNTDHNDRSQLQVTYIKQKIGGLRFFATKPNHSQRAQIDFAEFLSFSICEDCGTTQDINFNNDLVRTLCGKCAKLDFERTFLTSFS
ncbi:hypothetical protein E3V55_03635 [Candidatus Marinimicrobia bacterium MT.SAG.3]|nr:hypothetical protein E3V55_03635 [Candidatus Marinimicrobia bacterium MT.SAG.3]